MSRDKGGAGRAVMIGAEAQGRAGADTAAGHASSHPASVWAAAAPETRYAKSEDGYVAYQVFGRGSFDLLFIGNWASNVEVMWEHPSMARYLDRLGQFARVICFDKRGAGLSDPVAQGALPTLEHWMDDARIVLDAAGSETAALMGDAEGGPMAMMFAATYPQRSRALVLVNTFARMLRQPIIRSECLRTRRSVSCESGSARGARGSYSSCQPPAWPATHSCSAGLVGTCGSRPRRPRQPRCTDGCFRWTCGRC